VATRLILIGLVLLGLGYWALLPRTASARRVVHRWAMRLALVGGTLLLLRLGLPWLAMAGAALLAVLRYALPSMLRLLPLLLLRRVPFNPANQGGSQSPGAGPGARGMTRNRAFAVLNLSEGASREEVLKAHRDLIKRVHPDHGGSSYLASEVNQARDVLLSDEPPV
jgi:DnaJ family protein C protein 19